MGGPRGGRRRLGPGTGRGGHSGHGGGEGLVVGGAVPELMRQAARGRRRLDGEAVLDTVKALPQQDTRPERDGDGDKVHEVDEVGGEELPDGGGTAADADVLAVRQFLGAGERFLGRRVHEVEARPVVEVQGLARVVREHDDGRAERGLLAPPAPPAVVRPLPLLRAELAPAHDLRPDALTPGRRERAIEGDRRVHGVHALDEPAVEGREEPPGVPDGLVERDRLARAVAVERDVEIVYTDLADGRSLPVCACGPQSVSALYEEKGQVVTSQEVRVVPVPRVTPHRSPVTGG
ncbi:hypothetical protein STTU_3946 [Streptomyces sp. Tu6071]|nr:hypothetical protein STTU_3946 [Streptomyces sp. Tu6071]